MKSVIRTAAVSAAIAAAAASTAALAAAFIISYPTDDGSFPSDGLVQKLAPELNTAFAYPFDSESEGGLSVSSVTVSERVPGDFDIPVEISVWDDPNNDGLPGDAVKLVSVSSVAAPTEGLSRLQTYDIPLTPISGVFFVMVEYADANLIVNDFSDTVALDYHNQALGEFLAWEADRVSSNSDLTTFVSFDLIPNMRVGVQDSVIVDPGGPTLSPDGSQFGPVDVDGTLYNIFFADARLNAAHPESTFDDPGWRSLANAVSSAVAAAFNSLEIPVLPDQINGCESTMENPIAECLLFLPDEYDLEAIEYVDNNPVRVFSGGALLSGSAFGPPTGATFGNADITVMTFEAIEDPVEPPEPPQLPEFTIIDTGGVRVGCSTKNPDFARSNSSQDDQVVNCSILDSTVRANVSVADATVKVSAASAITDALNANGSLVDLITVTEGFGMDGVASGTFELEIDGAVDTSDSTNDSLTTFFITAWNPDERPPACLNDSVECGIAGILPHAEVRLTQADGRFTPNIDTTRGGAGAISNVDPANLGVTLSVPFSVTEDNPSFYIAISGRTDVQQGATDFFNTAKGGLIGNAADFRYGSKGGFDRQSPNIQPPDTRVNLFGNVENIDGRQVTALVLASGQFQFSNQPVGQFDLPQLPRENDGSVRRQVFARGFIPRVEDLRGTTLEKVVLLSSGVCPDFNDPSTPVSRPELAGQGASLAGKVFLQDTDTPVRALVLVNGQFQFSDANGNYSLEFPLDNNGQFTRQVYATGFAPSVTTFDPSTIASDARLARATDCQPRQNN